VFNVDLGTAALGMTSVAPVQDEYVPTRGYGGVHAGSLLAISLDSRENLRRGPSIGKSFRP
jgi:hypothetical protein